MPRKPTIKRGPASHYAMDGETIVEVFSSGLKAGCLISLREVDTPNGRKLVITPYRADPNVVVHIGSQYLKAAA